MIKPMKPKHQRLAWLIFCGFLMSFAAIIVLNRFNENIVFFYSPTELQVREIDANTVVRVGGLVKNHSLKKETENRVSFLLTDTQTALQVQYTGLLPNLFREGQGVVAEGHWQNGIFSATHILAKHDEQYMPPEVADAIKKSGHWHEGATAQ